MKTDYHLICEAPAVGVPLERFEYEKFTCSLQRAPIREAVTVQAGPQQTPGEPHLNLWVRTLRHPRSCAQREIIVETASLTLRPQL